MQGYNKIKLVKLSGTPYERGFQHGSELKEWIFESIERSEYFLSQFIDRTIPDIYQQFKETTTHLEIVKKYAPRLLEETRGIADGCGLEFDRIFAYQCNEEILLGMLSSKSQDVSFGEKCSSLGCSKTNDTPSFIGQNLDWMNYYEGFNVLLNIKDEESGLESFINTQPGLLIMNGMNNAPIGVCVNSLEEYLNCSNDGLPLVYILRLILEKNSLEEAVHLLHTLPHASAQNFVLGGISDVVDYECSANKVEKFTPPSSNGRVYHTNHPLANQDYRMLPHSFKNAGTTAERFKFMNYRMSGSKPFSIESAKLLLRSPFGPINRINDGTNSGGMTTFSTIFELSDNPVLHITVGPPSISEYQKFSLSKQIMNN